MKKWEKFSTVLFLSVILLSLTGCGNAGKEAEEAEPVDDYVYVPRFQSLDADGYIAGNGVLDKKGNLFYVGNNGEDSRLYMLRVGEEEVNEIPINLAGNTVLEGIGRDNEGNVLIGLIRYGNETPTGETAEAGETLEETEPTEAETAQTAAGTRIEQVRLQKLKADGSVLGDVDVTGTLAKQPDFYIQSLLADRAGNYYVCTGSSVFVFHPDGSPVCEASAGEYISSIFLTDDDRVVIGSYQNTGFRLEEVDAAQKGLKELEYSLPLDYGTYQSGTGTDLLYTQGSILYGGNLKDEKPLEILDWVDCDIDSNNLQSYVMLEDGRIAAFSVSYAEEKAVGELAVVSKKNRADVPQKTVLTYGSVRLPYFTNQDIIAFNKQSDQYRIEVKKYGDDSSDYESRHALLNADITSGNGPDIIDLYYASDYFDEYVSTGILEDLTPYLEKDKELKREDFLENVLAEYERDGKLYAIIPNFGIQTIAAGASAVGEGRTWWSVDDMIKLMDSKQEAAEILPYTTKDTMLALLCTMNQDLFVNPDTGECSFTGEEFKKILEFSNRFPRELNYDPNGPGDIEKIRNGQLLLLDLTLTSVQMYQMYEYMFGEPVSFVGYPLALSADSAQRSGAMIMPNGTTAGMNERSENKDGVWEFLRFNLTKDRQENIQSANSGFPITKSALEKQFEKDMKAEYYEDTDGSRKEKPKASWGNGDFTVDVYAATKEQVEDMREMLQTVKGGTRTDTNMFEIIDEEAQAFFEGQKSVQDVSALIQNRVQTYVNESR